MATDINVVIKQSKYEETRKRVSRFKNTFEISDKEIIEYLAKEIEQYRERIRKQEEYINELKNKQTILEIREDRVELKEIETINKFANERLIETITKYNYKKH